MIPVGSLDRITTIIGERGMGKSTYALLDARSFQRETGGFVLAHSPNGQIGAHPDVVFYDSVAKLVRGLKKAPGKIHVVAGGPPEELIRFGESMALAIRKRAHERLRAQRANSGGELLPRFRADRPAPKGMLARPVLVVIDEGVAMKRRPGDLDLADLERMLTSARHNHFAVTWSSQAPTARQWVLLEQSNRLRVFRYTHEYGANALRAAGISKDVVPVLRDLPRFAFYRFDKQAPENAGFEMLPKP